MEKNAEIADLKAANDQLRALCIRLQSALEFSSEQLHAVSSAQGHQCDRQQPPKKNKSTLPSKHCQQAYLASGCQQASLESSERTLPSKWCQKPEGEQEPRTCSPASGCQQGFVAHLHAVWRSAWCHDSLGLLQAPAPTQSSLTSQSDLM